MSSDFLWSEASADVHAERAALERSKALVALSEVRGFLVKASSAEEYDDRLSLMREDVNRVLAATDLSVHEEVLASLRADFEAVLAASRKTSASGDIGVGSDVIWTEFGVPDFHDEVFRTDRAQNGRPWRVTKIERLEDYIGTKYPTYHQETQADHLVGLAEEWVRKHPGLSGDPEAMDVAHIERNGAQAVVPHNALILSSVEVGAGQGQFSFASRKTAAAPQFDGHVTSENATVGQQVVLMGSSGGTATVTEVLPGHVKVRRAGGQIGDVLDYGWEDGQSYLMTPESVREASVRTASEDTFWLCEDCANEAWNRWKIAPISPAIPALDPGVLCEKCHKRVPSVFEFKGWRDYRKRTGQQTHAAGKEAASKTASGEWGESEWSDEGASRVETVPGREGYLVADVYPSEFETGVWVWSIKPSYPLSEYPEVYDLGHAANMDEAKAAADTAMGGAIQSYSRG